MTDPGPKSLADAKSDPVYKTPLMTTILISLLCVCSMQTEQRWLRCC
jgi:hypothetical protein